MDSTFAVVGDGCVVMAADMSNARSILVYKHDEDKIMELDSSKLIVGAGQYCDSVNFTEYIQKNAKLYELNNDRRLDTAALAAWIRNEVP
jgi:20S proteasome alpha/beta subunit